MAQVEALLSPAKAAAESPPASRAVPQPEPGLTPQMLIARATELVPLLREQQEASDQRGYYSDEVHQAFLKGGLYRILQPRLFGGYEMDFVTFIKVIMEISRGHPSTGWCYTLASSHALLVGSHWSEEAQRELFGPAGDFRAPHRAAPAGTFTRVDGGYMVSGVWSYSSGVPVSTHFIGGSLIAGSDGKPRMVNFIVPRDKVTILQDWGGGAALGMEGSGSHSVKIHEVFVPDRHVTSWNVILTLDDWSNGTPGTRLHGNPMYLGVVGGAYHTTFGAMLTGTARAALEEYEQIIRTKKVLANPNLLRMNDPESQRAFGKAMALADMAEAATLAAAQMYLEQCNRWAQHGTPITPADTLRMWTLAQEACLTACNAVELLFQTGGATAANRGQRLQRYFRDVQMYRVHPSSQPIISTLRGQAYLGLPVVFGAPP
jgi:3-hydroxy-9,10-secoandrosta-1,3,5(10)-triene-9,17-dione monooxygenase